MRALTLLSGTLIITGCSVSSSKMECPQPHASAPVGIASETPGRIAEAGVQLAHGGETAIADIVGRMRTTRPGVSRGAIVNYLVTAYCPEVNRRNELDARAKRTALSAFASRASLITAKLVPAAAIAR